MPLIDKPYAGRGLVMQLAVLSCGVVLAALLWLLLIVICGAAAIFSLFPHKESEDSHKWRKLCSWEEDEGDCYPPKKEIAFPPPAPR
jgi:hypothetical protein